MAKKEKKAALEVVSEVELNNGSIIKGFSDGSFKFYPAPIELSAEDVAAIFGGGEGNEDEDSDDEEDGVSIEDMKAALLESGMTKKELKKLSDSEIEEAYNELESGDDEDEEDGDDDEDSDEDEDDEEEVSIEDMKQALIESGMTKKELKKLSDEEIEEAYSELDSDDEEDEEDEDDSDDEDSEDSDDDDEEVDAESLAAMDFEDMEDLCDEKELDVDPDDFDEEDVEKLRSAIAKELGIQLPKKNGKASKAKK